MSGANICCLLLLPQLLPLLVPFVVVAVAALEENFVDSAWLFKGLRAEIC